MRRILAFTILSMLCSTAAFGDALRSDRHLLKIAVQTLSASSRQYTVQVFDAESRSSVANLSITTKGGAVAEGETVAGGTRYAARIVPYGEAYLIEFSAASGGEVIDSVRGGFQAPPSESKPVPAPPSAARGGRDTVAPAVIRRVDAVYTEDARAAGAVGNVVLEVLIDKSGFVRDATVLTPMGYGLSESAVDAVKQWQFEPSMLDRGPVEVLQEVTIEFKP